jgi:hypothetical protein
MYVVIWAEICEKLKDENLSEKVFLRPTSRFIKSVPGPPALQLALLPSGLLDGQPAQPAAGPPQTVHAHRQSVAPAPGVHPDPELGGQPAQLFAD